MGNYDEICFQLAEIHEDPEVRRREEEWLRAAEQFDADAVDYWNERTSAVARYRRGLLAGDEERRREAEGLSDEVKAALFRGRSPSGGARDVLWQVSTPGGCHLVPVERKSHD